MDDVLPELLRALREDSSVVLKAPPGAGKTTRVPPSLLSAGLAGDGKILVLEPRRIAARAGARRVSSERGTRLSEEVGYRVRFDTAAGPETRIEYVTEGVFLRMLQSDPFLEHAGAVVFDEFHERSLDADLALAMVRRVRSQAREDLRVVAMSATLDVGPVAEFLGARVVRSEGRLFPVEVEYLSSADRSRVEDRAAAGVRRALARTDGGVLCFLPGVGEIRRTAERLVDDARRSGFLLAELYGDLPPERQDEVLGPSDRQRVVLATNVAETSVTVEGITAVVDAGLARVPRHDPSAGLSRLETVPISRASADQRAGRAGRTAPGFCLRLWTEREHRDRPDRETPEVRRADLSGAALQLLAWGEPDVAAFPWFEPPGGPRLAAALGLLGELGAVADGRITALGRAMADLPVEPRLARLLVAGREEGVPARAALAAAILAERDPFRGRDRPRETVHRSESDVLDRVECLEEFAESGRRSFDLGELAPGAARFLLRARDQLARLTGGRRDTSGEPDEALLRALFLAFSDRLARRRAPGSDRGVLVTGGGVRLDRRSAVLDPELFVCVDLSGGGGARTEARVRAASGVRREWLAGEHVRTEVDSLFDPRAERVVAVRRTTYRGLVLDEEPASLPPVADVGRLLAGAARERLSRALDLENPAVAGFLARVGFLREAMPELEWPEFGEAEIREVLPALCAGRRSFEELRRAPLIDFLAASLDHRQRQALDRHAPERIEVPSGSRIRLVWEPGRPPVLAVRIQEMFGLAETPRVAAGRVPVLLHLLAPNQRPQQVTDDLASFWRNTWAVVRKDLRGRYPKHAWPEDPLSAPPERRPRKGR